MRTRAPKLPIVAAVLLLLGVPPTAAHHTAVHDQNPSPPPVLGPTDILHFDAGSLIIPMDGCYARASFMADADLNQIISPLTEATARCNTNAQKDDGLIPTYSLMFRLIQAGIPVSWSIRNAKTSFHDIDFSVVRAGGGPVRHYPPGGVSTNRYSTITTVRYRGAPFVIDAIHAAEARTLMTSLAASHIAYREVDVHVAQVGFDAPIYRTIEEMPKLAIIDATDAPTALSNEKTAFLSSSVSDAVMDDLEGSLFDWVTIPEVLTDALVTNDYALVWVPPFELGATPTVRQQSFMTKLSEFADAGGSILLQDGAISAAEGWGTMSGTTYTQQGASTADFMTAGAGIAANGVSSTWDNGNDSEQTRGQDYSDPPSQFGGIVWTGIGGSKYNWKPRYDFAYDPGVRRMIYSDHTTDSTKDRWDIATWRKKDNDPDKGTIYYLGGYNWRRVTASGFRILMNTLLATPAGAEEEPIEVSRSAPIVAFVDGTETQFSGTFEAQYPPDSAPTYASTVDAGKFEFPNVKGHVRGIDVAQLGQGSTAFDDAGSAVLFDAAESIPPVSYAGAGCAFPADGTCRRIFTERLVGTAYEPYPLTLGNAATLRPMLGATFTAADAAILIARIHAGVKDGASYVSKLGGIDRSTMAVIEPSPLLAVARPTMAYVGGLDGMLHAICAESFPGVCPAAGVELWAFMPSTEMSKVATNTARIDGSPKVTDVFGTFDGELEMKTVLTFQTGNRAPAATYALDVSDPANPDVLWKLATAGPGINTTMGWVRSGSAVKPLTFVQFASGTTTPGFGVVAVNTATGVVEWTAPAHNYPAPRDSNNPEVPSSAIPGGVTLLASVGGATIEHVLVPSLWGAVYKLDAQDGSNVYGTDPLFKFDAEDFHPIGASVAVYRNLDDGLMRGLIVTGGFADPFEPTGSIWAPDDVNQYAVGFPLSPDESAVPVRFEDIQGDPDLGLIIDFGAGQRAFSPAVVAGNEVFITTDTSDVNSADFGGAGVDTGRLWRQSLSGGAATYVAIPSGAASVDVSMTTGAVLTSGGDGVQRTDPPGWDPSVGSSTEALPERTGSRRLWLRLR